MPDTEARPDIDSAIRAFASPLRVNLLRHYVAHPGSQALAVAALGESSANISRNTQALMRAGVVAMHVDEQGGRSYSVDQARVWELLGELGRFILSGL